MHLLVLYEIGAASAKVGKILRQLFQPTVVLRIIILKIGQSDFPYLAKLWNYAQNQVQQHQFRIEGVFVDY